MYFRAFCARSTRACCLWTCHDRKKLSKTLLRSPESYFIGSSAALWGPCFIPFKALALFYTLKALVGSLVSRSLRHNHVLYIRRSGTNFIQLIDEFSLSRLVLGECGNLQGEYAYGSSPGYQNFLNSVFRKTLSNYLFFIILVLRRYFFSPLNRVLVALAEFSNSISCKQSKLKVLYTNITVSWNKRSSVFIVNLFFFRHEGRHDRVMIKREVFISCPNLSGKDQYYL